MKNNEEKTVPEQSGLDRFADIFSKIMMALCILIFAVMVASVSYGVVGRYVKYIKNPRWTQELAILCMVWLCFLGSGYAIKEGLHVRMVVINAIVPPKVAKFLHMLAYVLLLLVNLAWVWYGWQTVQLTSIAKMPATGWPLSVTYLSVCVGGLYGAAMSVYRLLKGGF